MYRRTLGGQRIRPGAQGGDSPDAGDPIEDAPEDDISVGDASDARSQYDDGDGEELADFQDVQSDRGDGDDVVMTGIEDDDIVLGSSYSNDSGDENDDGDDDDDEDREVIVDLSELRIGDLEKTADSTARAGLIPDEIIGAASYEELLFDEPPPRSLPFNEPGDDVDNDEAEDDAASASATVEDDAPAPIPHELRPKPKEDPTDTSTLLPSRQNKQIELTKFEMAIASFAELTGMSRRDYTALRETLGILRDRDGQVLQDVAKLPKNLSTLRDRMRKRLPLMDMRQAEIPLKAEKLPTERERSGKGKAAAAVVDDPGVTSTTLTFFDPVSVFKNFLSSDFGREVYGRPALFVDNPTELYHSHAWASSVRTSSGIYPHIKADDRSPGLVIFPNDFVYYRCCESDCPVQCTAIKDDDKNIDDIHIGRVYGFGYDARSRACTNNRSELVLQIQECLRHDSTFPVELEPACREDELVLISRLQYIPESHVHSHVADGVYSDHVFGEVHQNPGPQPKKKRNGQIPTQYPKYREPTLAPHDPIKQYYFARRLIDIDTQKVIPLCHVHPIRAELELDTYGRELYEETWDCESPTSVPVKSWPLLTFIDGFGVFRNSYRTLMGFYVTPAGMTDNQRQRPGNIFPLVLGPHGSDFGDVLKGMRTMAYLDKGLEMEINGNKHIVCAFTMCYIADMPQAAENSGFKGPRAHKFCRCCFIDSAQKSTDPDIFLNFDMVTHGRFHVQTTQMQHMMAETLTVKSHQEAFGTQWGIADPNPALQSISPASDLVLSRAFDPAHSEYQGLSNLAHHLLQDFILTLPAKVEYSRELRKWPFPPGWQRLQSPLHHLQSYQMSAHARWSIIIPAFLRQFLNELRVKPKFLEHARGNNEAMDPVNYIVATFAAIAKSNSVLMARRISSQDRQALAQIVRRGRHMFNQLCTFASHSGRRGRSREASDAGSDAGSVAAGGSRASAEPSVAGSVAAAEGGLQVDLDFMNNTLRPNIHIAMHYPLFAEEYAMPSNCNSLTGENLHRWFKTRVYETNYSNVEKVLLMKLNFQETVRLLLRNAFADDDPGLTRMVYDLYKECPNLFSQVLARTDELDADADADFELDVAQSSNESHKQASIVNRIPTREVAKLSHPINDDEKLPVRASTGMSRRFRSNIRQAYNNDYSKPVDYPSSFGNRVIQWSRKLAFTGSDNERYVFSVGDYVKYRVGATARIDHIFLLDNFDDNHIFVVITPIEPAGSMDQVLGLRKMAAREEYPMIVGITAIKPERLYMVPVDGVGLIWVDWDLHYL